jgi:hypothetical protein
VLTAKDGQLRAYLHELKAIREESWLENGDISLKIKLPEKEFRRLLSKVGIDPIRFLSAPDQEHWE